MFAQFEAATVPVCTDNGLNVSQCVMLHYHYRCVWCCIVIIIIILVGNCSESVFLIMSVCQCMHVLKCNVFALYSYLWVAWFKQVHNWCLQTSETRCGKLLFWDKKNLAKEGIFAQLFRPDLLVFFCFCFFTFEIKFNQSNAFII